MNRDRGISSNLQLYLHLISPSAHTPPLSFYLPLFPPFLNSLANFVSLSFLPLFLSAHASLCLFSPTNSLIISFLSPIFLPPPPYSPVLRWCQRSIRQLCSGWRGWRPGAVPHSECLSSPRPSVCPPSPMVLN